MSNKYLQILEITWIIIGVFCITAGIRYAITTGGNKIFIFVLMALVSFTFAWVRHRQRKKS